MMTPQNHNETEQPLIGQGWIRAVLFFFNIVFLIILVEGTIAEILISLDFLNREAIQNPNYIFPSKIILILMFFRLMAAYGLVWVYRVYIDRKSFISLGFSLNHIGSLFYGLVWGIVLIGIGFLTLYLSGYLTITKIILPINSLIQYFLIFLFAAVVEEIVFRGYILANLMDSIDKYISLGIAALLFTTLHFLNPNTSTLSVVNILLAGFLLGVYYIHRRGLWFPIGLHFAWNFFQGPVFGFEVSGLKMESIINQTVQGNELLSGGEFGFEGSIIATILIILAGVILHFQYQSDEEVL